MNQYKKTTTVQLISMIKEYQKKRLGLAFCAPSGTGKTTVLCATIQEILLETETIPSDIRVIKMSHHRIDENTTHKDCQQYRNLGVEVLATNSIDEARTFLQATVASSKICLVEGGRRLNIPSVVLQRDGFGYSNWIPPKNIVLYLDLK